MAGLALDAGLIGAVNDPVVNYVWDGTFSGEHNGKISWRHLLNQSSDWSGSLFGMADWADRPPLEGGIDDWKQRELHQPGTTFEYNDVRVNVLAYSLLQVWRKPLPVVLKEKVFILRSVFRFASDELRDDKSRSVPARLVTASPAETLRGKGGPSFPRNLPMVSVVTDHPLFCQHPSGRTLVAGLCTLRISVGHFYPSICPFAPEKMI